MKQKSKRKKHRIAAISAVLVLLVSGSLFGCGKEVETFREEVKVTEPTDMEAFESVESEKEENCSNVQLTSSAEEVFSEQEVPVERKLPLFSGATNLGTDGPTLDYVDDEIFIFHNYFGVVMMQYANVEDPELLDVIDLNSIGCSATQGDHAGIVSVSKDGENIYLYEHSGKELYRYDRREKQLYRSSRSAMPEKESFPKVS